jgi:RND family efflux transporter MFP subunit
MRELGLKLPRLAVIAVMGATLVVAVARDRTSAQQPAPPAAPKGASAPQAAATATPSGTATPPVAGSTAAPPAAAPKGPPAAGPPGGAPPPPTVTTSKPVQRKIVEWDEYTGRFDAVASVDIRARVSGYLNEVHFVDGQIVQKGAPLYSIDPRPFERAVEQAKAELAQAATKAENSTLDVERGRPLVDRKIMSEKVFDDRANALRDAQAQVKVSDAKVKTAELDLFFTKIASPVTGRISRSAVSAGSWISAGAAANASLLTSIVTEDPIHIYFDISENNWIKYRRMIEKGQKTGAAQLGTQIQLGLPDEAGFPHVGKVDFIDNRLDQATGTMRARAIVDNKAGTFSAGMFARARVQGSTDYLAVMLPDEAIGTDQTNKFVFTVADDGTVARKDVELGPVIDGLRIIRSGVTPDDWVITKGLQRARPGNKVTPRKEELKLTTGPQAPAKTQ